MEENSELVKCEDETMSECNELMCSTSEKLQEERARPNFIAESASEFDNLSTELQISDSQSKSKLPVLSTDETASKLNINFNPNVPNTDDTIEIACEAVSLNTSEFSKLGKEETASKFNVTLESKVHEEIEIACEAIEFMKLFEKDKKALNELPRFDSMKPEKAVSPTVSSDSGTRTPGSNNPESESGGSNLSKSCTKSKLKEQPTGSYDSEVTVRSKLPKESAGSMLQVERSRLDLCDQSMRPKIFDQSVRPKSSDQSVRPKSSDQSVRLKSSDQSVRLKSSDQSVRLKSSDQSVRPKSSDHSVKPKSSDHSVKPKSSDHSVKPKSSDHSVKPKSSDHSVKPKSSDHSAKPKSSDRSVRPKSSDRSVRPKSSGRSVRTKSSGHSVRPNSSDQSVSGKNSNHSKRSRQYDQLMKTIQPNSNVSNSPGSLLKSIIFDRIFGDKFAEASAQSKLNIPSPFFVSDPAVAVIRWPLEIVHEIDVGIEEEAGAVQSTDIDPQQHATDFKIKDFVESRRGSFLDMLKSAKRVIAFMDQGVALKKDYKFEDKFANQPQEEHDAGDWKKLLLYWDFVIEQINRVISYIGMLYDSDGNMLLTIEEFYDLIITTLLALRDSVELAFTCQSGFIKYTRFCNSQDMYKFLSQANFFESRVKSLVTKMMNEIKILTDFWDTLS